MQDDPENFDGMSSALCPLYVDPVLMEVEAHSADGGSADSAASESADSTTGGVVETAEEIRR